jgi:hypothetical protein
MSSTGAEPGDAADQAYFLEVERAFLALRGQATLLAADDWQTAREWHRLGIPVEFVVAVMESLFERQRERRSKRGISSLRYFRAAVAAAWDERLAHRAGGALETLAEPGPPAAARLAALAGAVPETLPGAVELRRRITGLAGPLAEVESGLATLERETLLGFRERLSSDARAELDRRVDRALARAAVPPAARDELRVSLETQSLRRLCGLPVLSLFSPAAQGPETPEAI